MNLNEIKWESLNGGYKIPYDASVPLNNLGLNYTNEINSTFGELWENLHHQGDVGLASYYSLPVLIDICIDKKLLDWNFIGLCVVIENCRHSEHNPSLPKDLENDYYIALNKFEEYLHANFKNIKKEGVHLALAFFASRNGQLNLGKAIEKLDDDIIQDILIKY